MANGNPLQYSCLENSMDRGAWQATVHRATESDTTGATYRFMCITVFLPNSYDEALVPST